MRRVLNGIVFAGAACALVALSGCASIEDVEKAQATADQAVNAAGAAHQAANTAQSAADRAQASADRAQQTASAAQATATGAQQGVEGNRAAIAQLNTEVEALKPKQRVGMRD